LASLECINPLDRFLSIETAGGQTRIRLEGTLLLGKGPVSAVKDADTLTSRIPHEYARSINGKGPSGFFRGRRIRTAADLEPPHGQGLRRGR